MPIEELQQTTLHKLAGIAQTGDGRSAEPFLGKLRRFTRHGQGAIEAQRQLGKLFE